MLFELFTPLFAVVEGLTAAGYIALYGSLVASAAGAAVSYSQQQTAAKQTEYNAQAQADAISQEQARKTAELAENRRRLALQSRRERGSQLADIVGSGLLPSSGTPLAIMADTVQAQATRAADVSTQAEGEIWQLGTQGSSILSEGRSSARLQRAQAGTSLVTGLANTASSAYGMYANRPRSA